MNKNVERLKAVKAMEFLARQVNDEGVFEEWLNFGPGDGDIEYGDLTLKGSADRHLEAYYCGGFDGWDEDEADEHFIELMDTFLNVMYRARESGGLFCGGVCSYD